jgi:hypothetical protein
MANTLDELMRESTQRLTGPHDRRIEDIVAYLRQERAKADMGKKAKRSEASEEINPKLVEAVRKMYPKKPAMRRF